MSRLSSALLRSLLLTTALAVAAAAVQPVYRVDADTIYLPRAGVALNAHTGRVVWRFPRLTGQVYTDGHNLLLVSWMSAVIPHLHVRAYRICRLRPKDGEKLWCHDTTGLRTWVADNSGRFVYLHEPGRLEVLSTKDGQPDRGFGLQNDDALTMLPLTGTGVMLLERHGGRVAEALSYRPGSAGLHAETVPAAVYPFHGEAGGLLLYAKPRHEFFLTAPLRLLFDRHSTEMPRSFPRASLDGQGFLFTDWQGQEPVVRGGTYEGALWNAPRRGSDPQLALAGSTAITLEPLRNGDSLLQGRGLNDGRLRYQVPIAADEGSDPRLHTGDGAVVVQTEEGVSLYAADTGARRWHVEQHHGTLAAITQTAVVFWEESGHMEALARNNGALLWRLRLQSAHGTGVF